MTPSGAQPLTITEAIAHVSAALVSDYRVGDVLTRLVDDAGELLQAEAVGVLMAPDRGRLEVLSATSHTVAELELFQIQVNEGPCIEVLRTAQAVSAHDLGAHTVRWPRFAPAAAKAGYQSVHASPMIWQGSTLGAFNVFRSSLDPFTPDEENLCQALADMATITVVRTGHMTFEDVLSKTWQALEGRHVIEQAKGVLAYNERLDMATAYSELKSRAAARGILVTEYARLVIDRAIES